MNNKLNVKIHSHGLVDDDTNEYEMTSDHSWVKFGRSISNPRAFTLHMIGTTEKKQGEGHASRLLDYFFAMMKRVGGTVKTGAYTAAGEIKIRHVIERLAKKYNVRLIQ